MSLKVSYIALFVVLFTCFIAMTGLIGVICVHFLTQNEFSNAFDESRKFLVTPEWFTTIEAARIGGTDVAGSLLVNYSNALLQPLAVSIQGFHNEHASALRLFSRLFLLSNRSALLTFEDCWNFIRYCDAARPAFRGNLSLLGVHGVADVQLSHSDIATFGGPIPTGDGTSPRAVVKGVGSGFFTSSFAATFQYRHQLPLSVEAVTFGARYPAAGQPLTLASTSCSLPISRSSTGPPLPSWGVARSGYPFVAGISIANDTATTPRERQIVGASGLWLPDAVLSSSFGSIVDCGVFSLGNGVFQRIATRIVEPVAAPSGGAKTYGHLFAGIDYSLFEETPIRCRANSVNCFHYALVVLHAAVDGQLSTGDVIMSSPPDRRSFVATDGTGYRIPVGMSNHSFTPFQWLASYLQSSFGSWDAFRATLAFPLATACEQWITAGLTCNCAAQQNATLGSVSFRSCLVTLNGLIYVVGISVPNFTTSHSPAGPSYLLLSLMDSVPSHNITTDTVTLDSYISSSLSDAEADVKQSLYKTLGYNFCVWIVLVISAFVMSFLVSRIAIRPLKALVYEIGDVAHNISNLSDTVRIPRVGNVGIMELVTATNSFMDLKYHVALFTRFIPKSLRELLQQRGSFPVNVRPSSVFMHVYFSGLKQVLSRTSSRLRNVVRALELYHSRLAHVICAQGGSIDAYLGDIVVVSFGVYNSEVNVAGDPSEQTAIYLWNALLSSLFYHELLLKSRAEFDTLGPAGQLNISYAIDCGPSTAGCVGEGRKQFFVFGEPLQALQEMTATSEQFSLQTVISDEALNYIKEGKAKTRYVGFMVTSPQLTKKHMHELIGVHLSSADAEKGNVIYRHYADSAIANPNVSTQTAAHAGFRLVGIVSRQGHGLERHGMGTNVDAMELFKTAVEHFQNREFQEASCVWFLVFLCPLFYSVRLSSSYCRRRCPLSDPVRVLRYIHFAVMPLTNIASCFFEIRFVKCLFEWRNILLKLERHHGGRGSSITRRCMTAWLWMVNHAAVRD